MDEVASRNERALIAAVILDNSQFQKCSTVKSHDFRKREHRAIWAAIESLAHSGAPFDAASINNVLHDEAGEDAGRREEADAAFAEFFQIIDGNARTQNAWWYADKVLEASQLETAKRAAVELQAMAEGGADPATLGRLLQSVGKGLAAGKASERVVQVVELAGILTQPAEPIPWQVDGYIAAGEAVTIAGEWGSGKSLLAMDLAVSLALGVPWMGAVAVSGGPYRVLYCDEENGQRLARHRIRQLLRGREVPPDATADIPLFYAVRNGMKLADPAWQAWLRGKIESMQATHVLLDSLIRFHRNDENSSSDNSAFFLDCIRPLMDEYGVTVVAIDHMGKPSREKPDAGQRVRGTSDKPGTLDELICIEGERDQPTRTMRHEKTRWDDLQLPRTIRWVKSDDGESGWIESVEERVDAEAVVFRIVQAGGADGIERPEIVKLLESRGQKWADRYATRTLGKLHAKGSVKRIQDGRYARYWVSSEAPQRAE